MDKGWEEVADFALDWAERHSERQPAVIADRAEPVPA